MRTLPIVLVLVGCHRGEEPPAHVPPPAIEAGSAAVTDGGPSDAPPVLDAAIAHDPIDAGRRSLGKHGDVCRLGTRRGGQLDQREKPVLECGPGLQCCYPCGIQGCDSVCHTASECGADRMRP